MRWPAARITAPDQRATTRLLVFAAAELVLAMAIPFILIRGYHTLLSSNTGTFVEGPSIDEPGWSALVSATPLTAVVEVVDGGISGATLIVPPGQVAVEADEAEGNQSAGRAGGTVILIPGDLSIPTNPNEAPDGSDASPTLLSDIAPTEAGEVLAALLNLDFASIEVMDETSWAMVLSDTTYDLENPDPVPSDTAVTPGESRAENEETDELAFAVGAVSVDGAGAAVFLGRPVDGGSLSSVMLRRRQFWSATLETPPSGSNVVASALRSVGAAGQIVELPTVVDPSGAPMIDDSATEELLRDVVAFPSGNRLAVRVVDRTGDADLRSIAAQLAGRGIEVVEIANAVQFDAGSTELIRPTELADGVVQFDDLVAELEVEPIVDPEQEHETVTLLVGKHFRLDD